MLKIKDKIILLEQALADHTIYTPGAQEGRQFCASSKANSSQNWNVKKPTGLNCMKASLNA